MDSVFYLYYGLCYANTPPTGKLGKWCYESHMSQVNQSEEGLSTGKEAHVQLPFLEAIDTVGCVKVRLILFRLGGLDLGSN